MLRRQLNLVRVRCPIQVRGKHARARKGHLGPNSRGGTSAGNRFRVRDGSGVDGSQHPVAGGGVRVG